MPDNDYVIRARITLDASTYESDIQGAVAANKAASDQMQADFAAAAATYRQKLAELTKQQNDYVKANVKLTDPAAAQVLSVFAREVQDARDEVTVLAAKMVGLDISTEQASKGFQLTDEQLKSIARSAELAGRQLITLADIERNAAKEGTTLSDLKVLENQAKQEVAIARSQQRSAQTTLGPSVNESPIAKAGLAQSNTELTRAESTLSVVAQKQIALTEAETAAARPAEALAEAQALITRQDETLAAVQAELAGSINTTAAAINSQYIVANKEATVATTAFIKVSTELGAAVKAGNTEAIQAVALLRAHYQQLLGVVEELAAREELMARAEAQSTEATLAEARAQVNNTISTEGSAVAALRLANAKREATNAAEKQAAAIISANSSIARSEVALDNLQAEVAANVGASASEMVAYVERAKAEIQNATSNLKSSQIVLGASQTAESKEAIASLTNTMIRAQGVLEAFSQKLATLRAQSNQQADAADVFKSSTDKQAEAIANVASATTELEQRFKAMKALIISTAGADFPTLDAALVRVRTDLKETQTALMQAQSALSSLGLGSREATAQLAATQATWIAMTAAGNDFIASVGAAKDAQQAENDVIAATADVNAQATAAIEEHSAVEKEVAAASGVSSEKIQEHAARAAKAAQDAAKVHTQAAKIIADAHKSYGAAIKSSVDEGVAALQKLDAASRAAATVAVETAARAKLLEMAEKSAAEGAIKDAAEEVERQIALEGSAVAALKAAESARVHAASLGNVGTNAAIARGAINELKGSEAGVVFAFSRMAASSKTLGPLIEKAFPIIGAIAFIDILSDVGTKVRDVIDALRGMDKFTKEMFQTQEDLNIKAGDFYVDLADKVNRVPAIGLGGTQKIGVELTADQEKLKNLTQQHTEAIQKVEQLTEARKKQAVGEIARTAASKPIDQGLPPEVAGGAQVYEFIKGLTDKLNAPRPLDEIEKNLKQYTEREASLQRSIDETKEKIEHERPAEEEAVNFERAIKLDEDRVTRTRRLEETLSEVHHKAAQEQLTDKKITDEEATKRFIDAENERFAAAQKAADAEDRLKHRQAAKDLIAYDPKAKFKEDELIALQHEEKLTEIQVGAARRRQEELKRIQEQQLKDLETRVSTATAEAPEGNEKRTELKALQDELQKLRDTSVTVGAIAVPSNLKEFEYLIKRLPTVTKEATKEAEKEVKETVDEQYQLWLAGDKRSINEIIHFWDSMRSLFITNAPLVKQANEEISKSVEKLRDETEKLNQSLEKQKELSALGALELKKLDIERKYTIQPQVQVNPLGITPEQREKQEIGQVELQEIKVKADTAKQEVEIARAANSEQLSHYQSLVEQKVALDRQAQQAITDKDKSAIAARQATLLQEIDSSIASGRLSESNYQDLKNKQLEVDQQYEQKKKRLSNDALADELNNYRKFIQQIDQSFLSSINEWIFGQKRFSQAVVDAWNNIVKSVVQDLEKIAAKLLEEKVIIAGLRKVLHVDAATGQPGQGGVLGTGVGAPGSGGQTGTQSGGGVSKIPIIGPVLGAILGGLSPSPKGQPGQGGVLGTGVGVGTGTGAAGNVSQAAKANVYETRMVILTEQLVKVIPQLNRDLLTDIRTIRLDTSAITKNTEAITALTKVLSTVAQPVADNTSAIQSETRELTTEEKGLSDTASAVTNNTTATVYNTIGLLPLDAALLANTIATIKNTIVMLAKPAATGGYIPSDGGLYQLHRGEVVVNHPVTSMLSDIAARGNAFYDTPQVIVPNANPNIFQSSSSQSSVGVSNSISNALASSSNNSSGDVHVHYAPTIHGGNNTPDLKKLLSEHADHIGRIVSRQSKSFNR